jgi:transposase
MSPIRRSTTALYGGARQEYLPKYCKLAKEKTTILMIDATHLKVQRSYDDDLHKRRHKIENMFAKLKDWRPIATRYDRSAHIFLSAVCIAYFIWVFED